MQWQVHLPIKVNLAAKKYFYLNLNQYRNAHYHTLNKAKILFAETVLPLLQNIPPLIKCSLQYTYYAPSKREIDVSNVCSIVDKFFSDTFVEAGKLIDDNYKYLDEVTYLFGGVDPQNPRVTVIIIQKDIFPMKVIITQADLQQALVNHISQFGIDVEPSQISVDLPEIEIELNPVDQSENSTESGTTTPKRKRRSSAEVAAEKAAKELEETVKASVALDTDTASTRTIEADEPEDADPEPVEAVQVVEPEPEVTEVPPANKPVSIFD